MTLASQLVVDMDRFVMAHEVSHILLDHFALNGTTFGAVGGSSELVGKRPDLEHAADLHAVRLVLADFLAGTEVVREDLMLRLNAIRLVIEVLELFESHTFVLQPTSHPPARERWNHIVEGALSEWLRDDLDDLLDFSAPLAVGLANLSVATDIDQDSSRVEADLASWIDRAVWKPSEWRDLAKLNAALNIPGRDALENLYLWDGWGALDVSQAIQDLVARVLASEQVTRAMHLALTGDEPLTKLGLLEAVEPVAAALLPPGQSASFPFWALANFCGDVLGQQRPRLRE